MAPLRGWRARGERLIGKTPHGRWRTLTFLAALRADRIDAPCIFDGPINGEKFRAYVGDLLLPTLRQGDVVVMDNLGSHKGKAVRQAIKSVGARLLFLPPYSPDLNPIEQAFSKLKHLLRRAEPRTPDALCAVVGRLLDRFQPNECRNYLVNSGYASA
jgi:transposase